MTPEMILKTINTVPEIGFNAKLKAIDLKLEPIPMRKRMHIIANFERVYLI